VTGLAILGAGAVALHTGRSRLSGRIADKAVKP
jgi:hypothetical protein